MTLEHLARRLEPKDKKLADLVRKIKLSRGDDIPLPEFRGMTMKYLIDYFNGSDNVLDRKLIPIIEGILKNRKGRDISLPFVESELSKRERMEMERTELIYECKALVASLDDNIPIHDLFPTSNSKKEEIAEEWIEFYRSLPLRKKQIITGSFNASANELRNRSRRLFGHSLDIDHSVILVSDFRGLKELIAANEIPDNSFTSFTAELFDRSNLPEKSE